MSTTKNIFIPIGYVANITTDVVSSGYYVRLSDPGGSQYTPTAITVSSDVNIGPFNEPRNYQLIVEAGDIVHVGNTYSGVLTAADDAAFASKASPTFTGTVVLPSTTSIGNVSSTELSYVDGVTSALQTQLNGLHPLVDPIEVASVDGAIVSKHGIIRITKAGIAALTLAAPIDITDDGKYINIISMTDFAHTITSTGNILNGVIGGSKSTITCASYAGCGITLVALGGKWVAQALRAVTIS